MNFLTLYFYKRSEQIMIGFPRKWPPLWSSGQSFWLQIQIRVRFPALPDFLSSSGSGTGSTQPREVNWGATWIKSSGFGPEKFITPVCIGLVIHPCQLIVSRNKLSKLRWFKSVANNAKHRTNLLAHTCRLYRLQRRNGNGKWEKVDK